MGTRWNRLTEAGLTYTHTLCFELKLQIVKKKNNIKNFHQKINSFTGVKYCCIFNGRVCVMSSQYQNIVI